MDADAQQILLASPLQVIGRLFELIRTSDFWRRVLFSSFTIMSGLMAGALAGVLLGAAAFFSNFIRELLRPQNGIANIKGHRLVGGMRASIYNAMPVAGVQKLIDVMKQFEAEKIKL